MALAKFDHGLKKIVYSNITLLHEERRKLKAQSDDGVMINVLWEKIESDFFAQHNTLYYMAKKEQYEGADGEKLERTKPLTTTALGESLKRSSRDIRKILTSLNLAPKNAPPRFRVGKRSYRGIFFDPKKMEKRLREFVVSYEKNSLYEKLGVSVPDVPNVPRILSRGLLNFVSQDERKTDPPERSSGTIGTNGTQKEERDARNTVFPTSSKDSTVQEALNYAFKMLDERPNNKSTGDIFIQDLQFKGLSKEEAEKLHDKLTEEGPLGYDNEGWLMKR